MSSSRSAMVAIVAVLATVGLVACADGSAGMLDGGVDSDLDTTPPPAATSPGSPSSGQQPDGFTTIRARITEVDGEVCEVCLWLADDAAERGRGLMGVTDLGDAVGMAFRFDEPVANPFYMLNTPTPLSIAWFSPGGDYAASTDMEPCLEVPENGCPLYGPGVEFELAIEVFQGGLGPLGLGPGSRVELIEGSEAERCPAAS